MAKARVEFDPELKTVYDAIKDTNPGSLSSLKSTNETALSTLASSVNSCIDTLTATDTWNDAVSSKIKSASSAITSLIEQCKEPGGTILTTAQGATSELQASLQEYDETLKELNEHIDEYNNLEANEPTKEETKTTTNADGSTTSTKKETDAHIKWRQRLAEEDEITTLKQQELDGYEATCDSLIAQLKGILSSIGSDASTAGLAMKFGKTIEWNPDVKEIDEKFDNSEYKVKGTETLDEDGNVLSRTYTIYDKNGKIVQTGVIKYGADGKEVSRTTKNDYGADPDAPDDIKVSTDVQKVVGTDGKNYNAEELQNGTIRIKDNDGNTVEIITKEEFEQKYKEYDPKKAGNTKEVVKLENGKSGTAEYQDNGTVVIYDEKGNAVEVLSKDEFEQKYKGKAPSEVEVSEDVRDLKEDYENDNEKELAEKAAEKATEDGKKLTEKLKEEEKDKNSNENNTKEKTDNQELNDKTEKSNNSSLDDDEEDWHIFPWADPENEGKVYTEEEAREYLGHSAWADEELERLKQQGKVASSTPNRGVDTSNNTPSEVAENTANQTTEKTPRETVIDTLIEAGNTREQAEAAADTMEKAANKINNFLDSDNKSEIVSNAVEKVENKLNGIFGTNNESTNQAVTTQNSGPIIKENTTSYYDEWSIKNEGNGKYSVNIIDTDNPDKPSYNVNITSGADLNTIKKELNEGNAGRYYMDVENLEQVANKIYFLVNGNQ